MNEKVKIGFPMEYEDDKHIIRTGLWLKEYEVEMLEKKLNEYNNLQSKIDKAIEYIEHYLKDIDNLDNVLINSILLKELLDILKEKNNE